jgi:very-short-patch-repair endonuclease
VRRKILPYNPKLVKRARRLRQSMTIGEKILWNELKGNKLGVDFDRQRPIDNYIVDFYCKDLMFAIEIDGQSHQTDEAQRRDIFRQRRLELLGVSVLRFDDLFVRNEPEKVTAQIKSWVSNCKGQDRKL